MEDELAELILNQFTKDHDVEDLVGKRIINIETQSVYSYSLLVPGDGTVVDYVQRANNTSFCFKLSNGSYYLVENGKVLYS